MKKRIIILIIISLLFSCKTKQYIEIYIDETEADDLIITGNNLDAFFSNDYGNRIILKKEIQISKQVDLEIEKLKDYIKSNGIEDNNGMGIYYNAIIHNEDTLYSSGFRAWKYNNKTTYYKEDKLIRELEKYCRK